MKVLSISVGRERVLSLAAGEATDAAFAAEAVAGHDVGDAVTVDVLDGDADAGPAVGVAGEEVEEQVRGGGADADAHGFEDADAGSRRRAPAPTTMSSMPSLLMSPPATKTPLRRLRSMAKKSMKRLRVPSATMLAPVEGGDAGPAAGAGAGEDVADAVAVEVAGGDADAAAEAAVVGEEVGESLGVGEVEDADAGPAALIGAEDDFGACRRR